jgi:putative transposase
MGRIARVYMENAYYHITVRGNQKKRVFLDEADFKKYLNLLHRYKTKFRFKIYGYCLMNNHIHLNLKPRTPGELSKFMHGINLSYTQYFNSKYKKVGHLWQGRFKSFLITKDKYLLNTVLYIENNPVRAQLVEDAVDYKWSSYRNRLLGKYTYLLNPIVI